MSENVVFTGGRRQRLAAIVDLPDGPAKSAALVVHCFPRGDADVASAWIARALAEDGYVVLRVDLSAPADGETGVDVADVCAAAAYLRSRHLAPAVLVGHSLGGSAVIAAAERIPESRAVVTIGTPSDPARTITSLADRAGPGRNGRIQGRLQGRTVTLDPSLLEDLQTRAQSDRLARLGRALLVLHAPQDAVVGIDDAREIFDAARHPKSFVSLDGADHLLSRRKDARFAAHVLGAWAARYVDAEPPTDSPPGALAAGQVQVSETGAGRFQQRVRVGTHSWTADEPVSVGGEDAGPSPYDHLLAGLGTCTSMTLRMYAERKGWDMGAIDVALRHDRVPDDGSGPRGGVNGRVDRIRVTIGVDDDLDDAQRESLLRIAGKCPVHRTLTHDIIIETELAGPGPAGRDGA